MVYAARSVSTAPRFDFVCQQPPKDARAECQGCNTPIIEWGQVEDPAEGQVGIWSASCPECGTFITVEVDPYRFARKDPPEGRLRLRKRLLRLGSLYGFQLTKKDLAPLGVTQDDDVSLVVSLDIVRDHHRDDEEGRDPCA